MATTTTMGVVWHLIVVFGKCLWVVLSGYVVLFLQLLMLCVGIAVLTLPLLACIVISVRSMSCKLRIDMVVMAALWVLCGICTYRYYQVTLGST